MYAPVAAALRCDRPTAKVAVLAAMYGQTSGAAGAALRDMDRTYPTAMAYLRAAEAAGREGRDLRTYGGRLLPLQAIAAHSELPQGAYGRFARNAVIQGAAAELFKAWAATVRDGLHHLNGRPGAAIVLCLHDELLVHVPSEQVTSRRRRAADVADGDDQVVGGRQRGPLRRRDRHRSRLGERALRRISCGDHQPQMRRSPSRVQVGRTPGRSTRCCAIC